jgi:hypothetical protein
MELSTRYALKMVEKRSGKNLSLKTGLQIINFNPSADEQPEVSMEGNHLDLGVPSVALMAGGLMKHVHNSTDFTELEPRGQVQCGTQLQMKERGSLRLSKQLL